MSRSLRLSQWHCLREAALVDKPTEPAIKAAREDMGDGHGALFSVQKCKKLN